MIKVTFDYSNADPHDVAAFQNTAQVAEFTKWVLELGRHQGVGLTQQIDDQLHVAIHPVPPASVARH